MTEKNPNLLPLLDKIAKENNLKNYKIEVIPISTGGANFSSCLYVADISGDGNHPLRLFIKAAAFGEKLREQSDIKPYDNEHFVYTNLMKVYRQLEEQHGLSQEHQIKSPKYYGTDNSYLHELLVLENLACQGYVLHDRMKPVDLEYARAAITELAKFHALSIRYEHENPQEFREIIAQRFKHRLFNGSEANHTFYDTIAKTALKHVRDENKDKLEAFLDGHNIVTFTKFIDTVRRPLLIHGDYRPSNMLHRNMPDGTVDLIVVDYQTIMYGSPVIDLLYFIFTATDGPTRAKYYDKMVNLYHEQLGRALARLGLDVENEYSAKDFKLELYEKRQYGLLLSCLFLSVLTVDESKAPKVGAELDFAEMSKVETSDLFSIRLNEVVDEYIALGILS